MSIHDSRLTIKVRGIYATALSTLLGRHGFQVVDASPVLAQRLRLPSDGSAEIELRDRPDHQAVRITGAAGRVEQAARRVASLLPDAVARQLVEHSGWEVELPGESKSLLDRERLSVWPTVPGHHHLKIVASEAVELTEQGLSRGGAGPEARAAELRRLHLVPALRTGRDFIIEHAKPAGKTIPLRGRIAEVLGDPATRLGLRLARRFQPGGFFDSLNAAKLPGDFGETEVLEGSWVARRTYLRAGGEPIGELYNIQTPAEFYPDRVRYLDLQVDVATWPDGRVEIVDLDELDDDVRVGLISATLAERALAVAEGVAEVLRRGVQVRLEAWC